MIKQSCIDRILDSAKIVDVVKAEGVELRRHGSSLVGLCPSHMERSPSFSVSESRNICKCFSCGFGGSPINFLMTLHNWSYVQAVEHLAKLYNITIENDNKPRTPEEQRAADLRESVWAVLADVQFYFEQCLHAETPESEAARAYAEGRWGAEMCRRAGIGYAPRNWTGLLKYLQGKGHTLETILASGVCKVSEKTKQPHDLFFDRITIPVRDNYGRYLTFTCRSMEADAKAKYMNTSESPVFKKSASLFGIDLASRAVRETRKFYVVEGAPDALRLQMLDIENVVAPLGTALGSDQFELMKRYVDSVCFIPDSDPPKPGEDFGPGYKAVMKNGRAALEAGLNVTVRSIPMAPKPEDPTLPWEKRDADSYITSREIFDGLNEMHFAQWYGNLVLHNCDNEMAAGEALDEVAGILAFIQNNTTLELCIDYLSKIFGTKGIWRKAISAKQRVVKEKREERATAKLTKDAALLRQFGIVIKDGCYGTYNEDSFERWSNFTMEPLYHIASDKSSSRVFRFKNTDGFVSEIELQQEELISLAKFQKRIESRGNFVWLVQVNQLNRLKEYLYAITETAYEVDKMGWHAEERFYAFGNGIFKDGSWYPVDKLGMVNLGDDKYYLPAFSRVYANDFEAFNFERRFIHRTRNSIALRPFLEKMVDVFGDNAMISFCYLLATLFLDVVKRRTKDFPLLNIFGEPGSGKTQLGNTLMSFFLVEPDPPSLLVATRAALNDQLAESVNALTHIDEYLNDIDNRIIQFLKNVFGGSGQKKKDMDGDKRAKITKVNCGLILSGQDKPTKDIALFTRVIFLQFSRTDFSPAEQERFDEFRAIFRSGLTHLTLQLLALRDVFEKQFAEMYSIVKKEFNTAVKDLKIHDRVFSNWLVPLAAMRTVEAHIDLPFSYADLYKACVAGAKTQQEFVRTSSEVGDFWKLFDTLRMQGRIVTGAHYKIEYLSRFEPEYGHPVDFGEPRPVLFLNYGPAANIIFSRAASGAVPFKGDIHSIESFLSTNPAFLGRSQRRFALLDSKGDIAYTFENEKRKVKVSRPRAMCFDYRQLSEAYDINLETFKADVTDGVDVVVPDESGGVTDSPPAAYAQPRIPPAEQSSLSF